MQGRLRFLTAATALLYFGALLAGLMGQGWGMVLAFLAVFLAWSMILRPQLWPSRPADLAQSQALVALAAPPAPRAMPPCSGWLACFQVASPRNPVLRPGP